MDTVCVCVCCLLPLLPLRKARGSDPSVRKEAVLALGAMGKAASHHAQTVSDMAQQRGSSAADGGGGGGGGAMTLRSVREAATKAVQMMREAGVDVPEPSKGGGGGGEDNFFSFIFFLKYKWCKKCTVHARRI